MPEMQQISPRNARLFPFDAFDIRRQGARRASGSRIVSSPRSAKEYAADFLRVSPSRISPRRVSPGTTGGKGKGHSKKKTVTRRASVSIFGNLLGSIRKRKNVHHTGGSPGRVEPFEFDMFTPLARASSRELQNRIAANFARGKVLRLRTGISSPTKASEIDNGEDREIDLEMAMTGIQSPGAVQPNPFSTPPSSPTSGFFSSSPEVTESSPESDRSRRKSHNSRLMSRMKTVQMLGVEASRAAAAQWMEQEGLGWE